MAGIVQPLFIITRNGKKLPAWMYKMITKVTFKESDGNGANESLEIYFEDPEFQIMDGGYFVEKKTKIKCKMGYIEDKYRGAVFDGRVEVVENDYPTSGRVTLKIIARDKTYQMSEGEHTKTYTGKTYSDIVKDIFKKYGFKCIVDSTAKIQPRKKGGKAVKITQSGMTDLEFIQACANKCHYTLVINTITKKAWFVKKRSSVKQTSVVCCVDYKEGNEKLKSFRPKFNDYKKAMKVKSSNVNIDKGKTVGNKKGKK